jgi:putative sterol carrier protein
MEDVADRTGEFFAGLAARGREPLLGSTTATIRIDIVDGAQTDQWRLVIRDGVIEVERGDGDADSVIRVGRAAFDRLTAGQTNALSAALRGELELGGDPRLLVRFQRLFPAPVGMPAAAGKRAVGKRRS